MGEYADMSWDPCDPASWRDMWVPRRRGPQPKTCNRCGTTGLVWSQTDDGWRLHSAEGTWPPEMVLHVCAVAP